MTVETRVSGRAERWGAVLLGAGVAVGLLVLSVLAFAGGSVTPNILGCTEGSQQACQIPPSGCPGVRICMGGSWGSCECAEGGPAGAFEQEYTVMRNTLSDNKLYGHEKASQYCMSDLTVL